MPNYPDIIPHGSVQTGVVTSYEDMVKFFWKLTAMEFTVQIEPSPGSPFFYTLNAFDGVAYLGTDAFTNTVSTGIFPTDTEGKFALDRTASIDIVREGELVLAGNTHSYYIRMGVSILAGSPRVNIDGVFSVSGVDGDQTFTYGTLSGGADDLTLSGTSILILFGGAGTYSDFTASPVWLP
jgi:hypothetical protein